MEDMNGATPTADGAGIGGTEAGVFAGTLCIAGDPTEPAVQANVSITDDGHLMVTSAGMVVASWDLSEVAIEVDTATTVFRRGPDSLIFVPADRVGWEQTVSAIRLRSRLSTLSGESSHVVPISRSATPDGTHGIVNGPTIQVSQSTAVMTPRRTTHWLHLLLTVITFGLWLPVWIAVSIYTASVNNRALRSARQVAYTSREVSPPMVAARKSPAEVRESNRKLGKGIAIGVGGLALFVLMSAIAFANGESGVEGAASRSTSAESVAPVSSTTTTTQVAAMVSEPETSVTTPPPSEQEQSMAKLRGATLRGTTGTLRVILEDLMDSTSCSDIEFDLKFATDNYSFTPDQAERVLLAVEYAQESGIGTTCNGLDAYL